jgi:hypothetical protein
VTPLTAVVVGVGLSLGGLLVWATRYFGRRLEDVHAALDDVFQQQRRLPTAEQLEHWGRSHQDLLLRGEREVRSASVQLRQTTDTLARRVQQVENLTGVDQPQPFGAPWAGRPPERGAGR